MSQMPPRLSEASLLPSDPNAERSVLGAALLRPAVAGWLDLDTRALYDPRNRWVWDAMRALAARGEAIDEVTLAAELASSGRLEAAGGTAYLGELALAVPTADNVEHYAAIVRRHWVSRQVLEVAGRARGLVLAGGYEGDELRDELCGELARITSGRRDAVYTLAEAELDVQRAIVDPAAAGDDLELLETGVPGIQAPRGVTTIVAARPSGGKTALLLQAVVGLVRATGDHAVICLGEDRHRTLGRRTLADATGIDGARLRRGALELGEFAAVREYAPDDVRHRVHIVHAHGKTMTEALREVRALAHQHRLVAMAYDYVQRARPEPETRALKRHDQLRVSADLFDVAAAELGCVALLGSQLNREPERDKRAPEMRDLKDCGALEEIAKVAFLLQPLFDAQGQLLPELLVHVGKNSEGAAGGVFPLGFDRPRQRFHTLADSRDALHGEGD